LNYEIATSGHRYAASVLEPCSCRVVTWQLQNVGFNDGSQATGWFSVDSVTHTFLDWSISVNGVNTTVFPNALYDPQTSTLNTGGLDSHAYTQPLWPQFYANFSMLDDSLECRPRQLRLAFSELPDAGGSRRY
jgi:hypothetical protein